jgi:hypothetical protein
MGRQTYRVGKDKIRGLHPLLGRMDGERVVLIAAGHTVQDTLLRNPADCPDFHVAASVIMPNHVHAILVMAGAEDAEPRHG